MTTPERQQPTGARTPINPRPSGGRRTDPAERRVFVATPGAWDAMTAALDGPAGDVPGLRELMSMPTVLDR